MSEQSNGEREATVSGPPTREGQRQGGAERSAEDHLIRGYN
ncbi:hypothetical protein [Actinophytocola sediminis]